MSFKRGDWVRSTGNRRHGLILGPIKGEDGYWVSWSEGDHYSVKFPWSCSSDILLADEAPKSGEGE